jgi:hypothetical protein
LSIRSKFGEHRRSIAIPIPQSREWNLTIKVTVTLITLCDA